MSENSDTNSNNTDATGGNRDNLNRISVAKAVEELNSISSEEPLASKVHFEADAILLRFVPVEIFEAYENLVRRTLDWRY